MKRLFALLSVVLLVVVPACAQKSIQVWINGQPLSFDEPPATIQGRVLVPVRGVFERLGARVEYDNASRTIVALHGGDLIKLTVGSNTATINGETHNLDVPATMVGSRVLVPLRFVSEAMGEDVYWDARLGRVRISTSTAAVAPVPPAPATPPAAHTGPVVTSLSVDTSSPLRAGQILTATLVGEPEGDARFDVGGRTGIRMIEDSPGTYRGSYTVRPDDNNRNAVVAGRLTLRDGRKGSAKAPSPVALVGSSPEGPRRRSGLARWLGVGRSNAHLIGSVGHNGVDTLVQGQTLKVTMTGETGGTATFDVGGRQGLAMAETSKGSYVGNYAVLPEDNNRQARVVVHLSFPDGRSESMQASQSAILVGAQSVVAAPAQDLISFMTHNGLKGLYLGDPLNVRMRAMPGGRAWFDVGGSRGIPMVEGPSGTYLGTYRVAAGDNITNDTDITGHIVMPDGRNQVLIAAPAVGLYGFGRP